MRAGRDCLIDRTSLVATLRELAELAERHGDGRTARLFRDVAAILGEETGEPASEDLAAMLALTSFRSREPA